jgi:hypothetical protein
MDTKTLTDIPFRLAGLETRIDALGFSLETAELPTLGVWQQVQDPTPDRLDLADAGVGERPN